MRPIYENCLVDFFRMKAGKQQKHIYYFHQLQCVSRHPEYFMPSKRLLVEKNVHWRQGVRFFSLLWSLLSYAWHRKIYTNDLCKLDALYRFLQLTRFHVLKQLELCYLQRRQFCCRNWIYFERNELSENKCSETSNEKTTTV